MKSRIEAADDRMRAAVRDFLIAGIAVAVALSFLISRTWPAETRGLRWQVAEAKMWSAISPRIVLLFTAKNGARPTARAVLSHARLADPAAFSAVAAMLYTAGGGGLLTGLAVTAALRNRRRGDAHLRGARLVSSAALRVRLILERVRDKLLGRPVANPPIFIGEVPVPRGVETLHFLVAGSTGTGKSQLIRSFLRTIRARGERAIVTDIGGDLVASCAATGDKLLNPLDSRSVHWSPFAEMRTAADAERIAQSMVPSSEGESGEWHRYSQSLIAAVLQRLFERGEAKNQQLLHYLTIAKSEEIEQLVAGLPASTLFDTGASKMLSSVRGIIGSYLPAYRFLSPAAGHNDFSLGNWVADTGSGWLWMPYRDRDAAAVRPLLAAWVGEVVSAVLSLRPDSSRRVWLILDELASLGLVSSLTDALTKGRKFGLAAVLGVQSVSQLRGAYGRENATTLLSCLRNSVVLGVDDPETADSMSRRLGDEEIERADETVSAHGTSTATRRATSRVVMPSEIANLPNLTAFVKFAGDHPVARVRIPYSPARQVVVPFSTRADVPRGTSAP